MRVFTTAVVLILLAATTAAQAPASRPTATLAQLMRGIWFPNANILFDVQGTDPAAAPKKFGEVGATATQTYSNIYTGWQVVENAALALEEASDLLLKPGRLCENGRPAPLDRADWPKFVQGMRAAAQAAFKAAQSRNREAAIEVTNQIADGCATCHDVYRDKPDPKLRCIP